MKKLICKIVGHIVEIKKCPVTDATLTSCSRCGKGKYPQHNSARYK